MIEYALLFGLGFLSAMLVVMLLAPAIHRRIVKFTEDRILATVPVSPQELRAQKDMVRAEMATIVARTGHDLKQERGKAATLNIKNDQLIQQANALASENFDLRTGMETMQADAGELRAELRREEMRVVDLREQLTESAIRQRERDTRISQLLGRIQQLTQDVDNLRIDMATRDTEAESFRARINALRDERESLRNDVKLLTQRAKDAELRLAREENKSTRLEDRLNTEVTRSIDKDTVIERRMSEIARLKERLKTSNGEGRSGKSPTTRLPPPARVKALPVSTEERRALAAPRITPPARQIEVAKPALLPEPQAAAPVPTRLIDEKRAAELSDEARSQASAASDMLLNLDDASRDEAMRAEIADIAAKMVAVVAQKEGMSSSLRAMVSGKQQNGVTGRLSLAGRASALMHHD